MSLIPELTATQEDAVYAEVLRKHPSLTRPQFEQLLIGANPFTELGSTEQNNPDVDQCIAYAKELYDVAVDEAKKIKNPVFRFAALVSAAFVFIMAKIKCNDDYGEQFGVSVEASDSSQTRRAKGSAPSVKGGSTTAAGKTPRTSKSAKRGDVLESTIAIGEAHYFDIQLKKGEGVTFTIYTQLTQDSADVNGSFAIQDAEGGTLDETSLLISATGEDFDREVVTFEAEEEDKHLFRIRAEKSVSDEAPVRYRIKIK